MKVPVLWWGGAYVESFPWCWPWCIHQPAAKATCAHLNTMACPYAWNLANTPDADLCCVCPIFAQMWAQWEQRNWEILSSCMPHPHFVSLGIFVWPRVYICVHLWINRASDEMTDEAQQLYRCVFWSRWNRVVQSEFHRQVVLICGICEGHRVQREIKIRGNVPLWHCQLFALPLHPGFSLNCCHLNVMYFISNLSFFMQSWSVCSGSFPF